MSEEILDERQQRIHRRLALIGRGPAAFFLDACRVMRASEDYAAATHIVGHAMREIESSVRDVFEPIAGYETAAKKENVRSKERHAFEIKKILEAIHVPVTDAVGQEWLRFAGETDRSLNRLAHRRHLDLRGVDSEFQEAWDAFQRVLDAVLGHLEDRFFVFIKELDQLLLVEIPEDSHVQRLQDYVVRNVTTDRYFFERLQHAGWLERLRAKGVFKNAPPGYWAVAEYVRRMATLAPKAVVTCLRDTPTSVSFWTAAEFLDASTMLDVRDAEAWSREWLLPWLNGQERIGWFLPEKLRDLVLRLASSGHETTALAVAKAVLTCEDQKGTGRLDPDDFETFVAAVMPVLSSAAPDNALQLSLELFLAAVRIVGPERARFDTIWRPSIEHDSIYADQLLNTALSLVRDVAVQFLTAAPERTGEIVDLLLRPDVSILRRLAWFLLARFGTHAREKVRAVILDPLRLRNSFDYGEYGNVLRSNVGLLDAADQASVIAVLDAGPDLGEWQANVRKWRHMDPTETEAKEHVERWRLRFLRQIESILGDDMRTEYEVLIGRYGEPKDEDYEPVVSWGAPSPRTASDLVALSTDEVVAFLRTWTPGEGLDSREGLGDALRDAVKLDVRRFSSDAAAFMVEEAVYVADLIGGFDETLQAGCDIEWPPVLALCAFALEHDSGAHPGTRIEGTWGWAHQRVAWLLSHALDGTKKAPETSAPAILDILSQLLARAEPRGPVFAENTKSLTAVASSLNSVRGVAADACVMFGMWRRESGDALGIEKALQLLARVCDEETSEVTHASLGRRFLFLWDLDQDWLAKHRQKLFPSDPHLWSAAWAGYITGNRAHSDVFEELVSEYERAVNDLDPASHGHDEIGRRLGQHLGAMYLSGALPLESHLFQNFFDRAVGDIRGVFHWVYLRAMADNKEKVTDLHWSRIRNLWDQRIASTSRADDQEELHWFGWFATLVPDSAEWLLKHLGTLMTRGIALGFDHDVLARVAMIAREFPRECFAYVRSVADADQDGRHIRGWRDDVEKVLAAAREAGDPSLAREVDVFINRLASRDVLTFRHLLTPV